MAPTIIRSHVSALRLQLGTPVEAQPAVGDLRPTGAAEVPQMRVNARLSAMNARSRVLACAEYVNAWRMMPGQSRGATHYVLVATAGFSEHADWSRLRRTAGETGSVISAIVIDGALAVTVAPAQDARSSTPKITMPRPTREPGSVAWASVLDGVYHAQAAIPSIQRTEVHVYGDASTGRALSNLAHKDGSIVVEIHDERPDSGHAEHQPRSTSSKAKTYSTDAHKPKVAAPPRSRASAPIAPPARPRVPIPTPPSPPVPTTTHPRYGRTVKRSFKMFGIMLGVSIPLWFLTPVVASFGTLVIPGLNTAVFAASENNGRSAGDGPATLYGHLALILALTCAVVLVLNLAIGTADEKFAWLPALFTVGGVIGFLWLVISKGGELWMWDVAPASGVVGYILAQLLTRMSRS